MVHRQLVQSGPKPVTLAAAALLLAALAGCIDSDVPTAPRLDPPQATVTPIIFTISNTNDAGPGSLRQAILDAGLNTPAIMQFDPSLAGQTIVLASSIQLGAPISIEGPAGGITLDANGTGPVIFAGVFAQSVLRNLTVTGGKAPGGGGIYVESGAVTLENVTVSGNFAIAGGGIYANQARLTVINSTVSGNVSEIG